MSQKARSNSHTRRKALSAASLHKGSPGSVWRQDSAGLTSTLAGGLQ